MKKALQYINISITMFRTVMNFIHLFAVQSRDFSCRLILVYSDTLAKPFDLGSDRMEATAGHSISLRWVQELLFQFWDTADQLLSAFHCLEHHVLGLDEGIAFYVFFQSPFVISEALLPVLRDIVVDQINQFWVWNDLNLFSAVGHCPVHIAFTSWHPSPQKAIKLLLFLLKYLKSLPRPFLQLPIASPTTPLHTVRPNPQIALRLRPLIIPRINIRILKLRKFPNRRVHPLAAPILAVPTFEVRVAHHEVFFEAVEYALVLLGAGVAEDVYWL